VVNPTFARRSTAAAFAVALLAAAPAASSVAATNPPPEKLPAASQFAAGTCTSVAEPVLAVAKLSARYHGTRIIPSTERKALQAKQNEIAERGEHADPQLRAPLTDLVTAIGFVRLRYASRTYDPALLDAMDTARRNVQRACVR
jgi:hypothetical protein